MSRTAIVADVIRTQARQLKMPALARAFEELARQAREEHWAYEDTCSKCASSTSTR
jgi:hypothetical protein